MQVINQCLERLFNIDARIANPLVDIDRSIYTEIQRSIQTPLIQIRRENPDSPWGMEADFLLYLVARRLREVNHLLQNPEIDTEQNIYPFDEDQLQNLIRLRNASLEQYGMPLPILPRDRAALEQQHQPPAITQLFQYVFYNPREEPQPPNHNVFEPVNSRTSLANQPLPRPPPTRFVRRALALGPLVIPPFRPENQNLVVQPPPPPPPPAAIPPAFWEPVQPLPPINPRTEFEARQGSAIHEYFCGLCADDHLASAYPHVRVPGCNHPFCQDQFNAWDQHLYNQYRRLFCPMCRTEVQRQSEPQRL